MIEEQLKIVEENIQTACKKAGRDRKEVTLIAVSKTKPASMVEEAYACGIRDFGENKVQELVSKEEILPKDIKWHQIGHLQRNKVKYIVDKAALIHSVDSIRLANQIEQDAAKADIICPILLEVNVAREESKFGFLEEEVMEAVEQISHLPHVQIKGLMTIAPFVENPEENRIFFKKLKQLSVDIAGKNIDNVYMNELSMGMTGDYMVAVEEGATFVRVGTGIFGERNYTKTNI
ncbi:MAG: YggS family pyridoxal phosphate-dependent enzyme [Clostridiales bacterium]|nr:YggS family pyridoxal phosphate-dependent enzyme [Clostridiales bacterium]